MSGLAPDAIKNFIVSYLSESGLQTLVTKLVSFSGFVAWLQPIIKGVDMLYQVMKDSIEKFLRSSQLFTQNINLITNSNNITDTSNILTSSIKSAISILVTNASFKIDDNSVAITMLGSISP